MNAYPRAVCLAWLASAGLNPLEAKSFLALEPDPVLIYTAWRDGGELTEAVPLPEKLKQTLRNNAADRFMDKWAKVMEQQAIHAMTMMEDIYPDRLRPLPDAPAILFYQGDPHAPDGLTVSMVGSRNASIRGLDASRKIAEELSRNSVRIISGLAYGIDAAAHQGCLKGGSPTVAVLGCGLDRDYPAENAGLKRQILAQGGLLLSEYAPGDKPLGWHFPFRNRIISGLGDCLAMMEARIKSGSMTSVQHALEQGKEVFVYPGDPASIKSEGNHQLLREGANYFTTAEDLMEDMHWLDKRVEVGQNRAHAEEQDDSLSLSQGEQQLLSRLEKGEQSFDQLCAALNCSAAQLNANLSMLQIRGLIRALPGKIYQINQDH